MTKVLGLGSLRVQKRGAAGAWPGWGSENHSELPRPRGLSSPQAPRWHLLTVSPQTMGNQRPSTPGAEPQEGDLPARKVFTWQVELCRGLAPAAFTGARPKAGTQVRGRRWPSPTTHPGTHLLLLTQQLALHNLLLLTVTFYLPLSDDSSLLWLRGSDAVAVTRTLQSQGLTSDRSPRLSEAVPGPWRPPGSLGILQG